MDQVSKHAPWGTPFQIVANVCEDHLINVHDFEALHFRTEIKLSCGPEHCFNESPRINLRKCAVSVFADTAVEQKHTPKRRRVADWKICQISGVDSLFQTGTGNAVTWTNVHLAHASASKHVVCKTPMIGNREIPHEKLTDVTVFCSPYMYICIDVFMSLPISAAGVTPARHRQV